MAEKLYFTVSLSLEAHSIAQQLSRKISNKKKATEVYLKTLAVYAVDFYLQFMGFETDWENSDSQNPSIYKLLDVADLEIKQIGKIECRPVLPNAQVCQIPPEVWEDRIGYVAVQLDQSLKQAFILGFTEKAAKEVPLSQLRSLEHFLDYLSHKIPPKTITLGKWFEGIIDASWMTVDELLNREQVELAFMFRDAVNITRGQQIDLGMQLAEQSVALVITLPPKAGEEEVDLLVQLHPMGGETYLPEKVKLVVLDKSGEAVLDTEAREADNFIQLQFSAELGEQFSIIVTLGEASFRQDFVI